MSAERSATAAMVLAVLGTIAVTRIVREKNRAVLAQRAEAEQRTKAEGNLARFLTAEAGRKEALKRGAPALVAQARAAIEKRAFDEALLDIEAAIEFNPQLAEARMLKAHLLIHKGAYDDAAAELERYLGLTARDEDASALISICRKARTNKNPSATAGEFAKILFRQKAFTIAADLSKTTKALLGIYRQKLKEAQLGGMLGETPEGTLWLGAATKNITDLSPLRGMQLTSANLGLNRFKDLSPLKGMPLESLHLTNGNEIQDLSPLKGMRLKTLSLRGCSRIKNLSALKGMPLTWLHLGGAHGGGQGTAVAASDFSPLSGMPLEHLNMNYCSHVTDLSFLRGMKLKTLALAACAKVVDLSPLKGMPLESLDLRSCVAVSDLSPLKGLPLKELFIGGCAKVKDLSPLEDMPLSLLDMSNVFAPDLSPLTSMPLKSLNLTGCANHRDLDLSPLRGMPLESLTLHWSAALSDISPLKSMPLKTFWLQSLKVSDISPLKGMPLETLTLACPGVKDLSPLKECRKLETITIDMESRKIEDVEFLRGLPKLQ
ncbi:tetratricopeptide repeat protein, partial [Planctomycetota bacterium]